MIRHQPIRGKSGGNPAQLSLPLQPEYSSPRRGKKTFLDNEKCSRLIYKAFLYLAIVTPALFVIYLMTKGAFVMSKYTRDDTVALLKNKYAMLGRLPMRSDFDEQEVVAIKAFLGPWPRALEAAGLKEPRSTDRLELNRQKRIRAKRNRREKQ